MVRALYGEEALFSRSLCGGYGSSEAMVAAQSGEGQETPRVEGDQRGPYVSDDVLNSMVGNLSSELGRVLLVWILTTSMPHLFNC